MSCTIILCFSLLLFFILSVSTSNAYYPPTTPPPPSSSQNNQFLAGHKEARAAVRLPPLAWDSKLEAYAKWWANKRRNDCALTHSSGPYGENIFWGSGTNWSPAQAVNSWVSERRWYNYYSNSCSYGKECGHYTQIVWKNTRRVGCAKVICYGGRGVFITCNYDPPGNYIGKKPY